jgi:hypothetical protein
MDMKTKVEVVQGCLWEEDDNADVSSIAERYFGKAGRLLYSQRSMEHPKTILNASVFMEDGKRVWFGDLDLERSAKGLLHLSLKLGALYVHYEMPADFRGKLSTEEARASAAVMVERGQVLYSRKFVERMRELKDQMTVRRKFKKTNTYERRFF